MEDEGVVRDIVVHASFVQRFVDPVLHVLVCCIGGFTLAAVTYVIYALVF